MDSRSGIASICKKDKGKWFTLVNDFNVIPRVHASLSFVGTAVKMQPDEGLHVSVVQALSVFSKRSLLLLL